MSKTLFISDLDGTLLDADAELSEYAEHALNRLISHGVYFSVATARTAATCDRILEKVDINVPVVLMNGVLIYDIRNKCYIKRNLTTPENVVKILNAEKKTQISGLMYGLKNDKLVTYFRQTENVSINAFIDERVNKFNKKFTELEDFSTADADIIYFCYIETFDRINRHYNELRLIPGLRIEKYKDIYSVDDLWYMEVFADTASKQNAVDFLRRKYGFERVVSFGDNLNDLPLFDASDETYAVENAKPELKRRATAIIPPNTADGVVKWLEINAKHYL